MYEHYTVETIKSDILGRLNTDINTSEGSYTNDMISAVAYEIWKYYQALNAVIPIAFVDETSGGYIDKRCGEYGITRKEGTKATTTLTLVGTDNTIIPAGKVFSTSDGLQFETDEEAIISRGIASVIATAVEIGTDYNVDADTVLYQLVTISGLTSVTNAAARGGTDEETDAALVGRLYDYLRKPATSGNISHYRQWALSVAGVGAAKVFPLWDGPGTVKVVIADSDKQPASAVLVNETIKCIESSRPIGATVTVASASGKAISVFASVVLAAGYALQTVQDAFERAIERYISDIAFDTTYVSHAQIGTLLLSVPGVIDYSGLQLNGTAANIALEDEQIPVLGTITLEVI